MSTTSSFAHVNKNIGLVGFVPEVTQGSKNSYLRATGGSATTITVDTSTGTGRDDLNLNGAPDDLFNGLQVYFESGSMAGEVYGISDFTEGSGTATFTTPSNMSTTPGAGDLFRIIGPLPASGFSISPVTEDLPRDFHRLSLDPPSSVKGLEKSSGSCDLELPGLNTTLGDGVTAVLDRFSQLLSCLGTRRAYSGTTVSGSGSTTTVIDVTSAAGFQVGDLVMINGEVARITAVDTASTPDNITVTPPLSSAPTDTTVVYGAEIITPDDTGHRAVTWMQLLDDRFVEAAGGILNFGLSGEFGQLAMGKLDWDGEGWVHTDAVALDGTQLSKAPIPFVAGRAYFGTTQLHLNSFEFDLAHGRQELRDTSAGVRHFVRERKSTLKLMFRDINTTPIETWQSAGTKQRLLLQIGNTAGSVICIEGWGMIGDPVAMGDVAATQYWDATFFFFDDQDAQSATKPRIARF